LIPAQSSYSHCQRQLAKSMKSLNMYFATHRTCNLSCSYCYVPEYNKKSEKASDELILEAHKKFLDKAKNEEYQILSFCLHGSEPSLIRPETFAEIANRMNDYWAKTGYPGLRTAIQSNGIRFTGEYLSQLNENLNSKKLPRLGFSIDPPREVHNKFRNNSFDKAYSNFHNAMTMGFPVSALSVVTKDTMKHLDDFGAWFKEQLALKKENGNPYKLKIKLATGDMSLTSEEKTEFADFLARNELFHLLQILTPGYCIQAGNECMWYEFDIWGKSYSCNKVYGDSGVFADWHNESFDSIVGKRKALYAENFRSRDCDSCQYEFICNSGCPVDREGTGLAHECEIIKYAFDYLDKRGIHYIDFLNRNSEE
jgi:radical SAM protein with 4Fe4S-binding SPASM domain